MADDLHALLALFTDIARIELGVGQLAAELERLAGDDLLEQAASLADSRAGIAHLAASLTGMEIQLAVARAQVTEAITGRRADLAGIEAVLTLYRDVARAELDVTQLSFTLEQTTRHRTLAADPSLAHLGGVLGDVHERLERDRGILADIEARLTRFLADG